MDALACACALDCSYLNDVKTKRETDSHPSVSLVAEADGHIVGWSELEIEAYVDSLLCARRSSTALDELQGVGSIYDVEEIVFQAEYARKAELSAVCDRIDEVRLYAKRL